MRTCLTWAAGTCSTRSKCSAGLPPAAGSATACRRRPRGSRARRRRGTPTSSCGWVRAGWVGGVASTSSPERLGGSWQIYRLEFHAGQAGAPLAAPPNAATPHAVSAPSAAAGAAAASWRRAACAVPAAVGQPLPGPHPVPLRRPLHLAHHQGPPPPSQVLSRLCGQQAAPAPACVGACALPLPAPSPMQPGEGGPFWSKDSGVA